MRRKRCTKCGVEKRRSEFYSRAAAVDGLASECKACKRATVKAYDMTQRKYSGFAVHRVRVAN